MDKLDQAVLLLQEGKGEEALAALQGEQDTKADFLRVSAYLSLSRLSTASELFFKERDAFFDLFPKKTIEVDFELRFLAKDFSGAYGDIAYFNDKPYVSQEVEEVLRSLPRLVSSNVAALTSEGKSAAERLKDLHSEDDYVVLSALSRLDPKAKDEGLRKLVRSIAMSEERSQDLRTYALLFLKAYGDEEPLIYRRKDLETQIVPRELPDPTKEEGRLKTLALLEEEKDVGAARLAASLLESAVIASYPVPYPKEDYEGAAKALLRRALVLLGDDDSGPSGPADQELEELLSSTGAIN